MILSLSFSPADIPARTPGEFKGIYQVTASTDPIFPLHENQEWFLDFGQGIRPQITSGSVAVSLRQNPNVRVRIMAWQYFPGQGSIALGNPYASGSRQAVAKGVWKMSAISGGFIFKRDNYQVVLSPADPRD
ncbi:MAG TPA: hypothetical protein VF258_03205 [Luteolibacter sp.]